MVPRKAIAATIAGTALALSLHGVALAENEKIEVTLSAPAHATAPASIALSAIAIARQQNHPVTQVEFFQGELLIGVVTAPADGAQYVFHWTNVPAGAYAVMAKATNDKGDTDFSEPIQILVNAPPSVTLIEPSAGAIFAAPAVLEISANAADSDGSIARVEFFAGMERIGTATEAPYSLQWPNVASGTYSLTAVAIDNQGAASSSPAVLIRVNSLPSLSLTSPAANATFTAPANITFTAEAADSDGSIARVDFFSGNTLIATTSFAPFSFVWSGVPQGTYALTARAIDDVGSTVISTTINVIVNSAVAQLYFIHVDHLNTPRLVVDAQQRAAWRWDHAEPFGDSIPDNNPWNLGIFDLPLRLPGQYFDRESNLRYNYFRDYDADIGRYVEADPVGLIGGLNGYVYVLNKPLSKVDLQGLMGTRGNQTYGCGSGWNKPLVPDNPLGYPFLDCCNTHDRCYDDCVTKPTREECDVSFCSCIRSKCYRYARGQKVQCENLARDYCYMVVENGEGAYRTARGRCPGC